MPRNISFALTANQFRDRTMFVNFIKGRAMDDYTMKELDRACSVCFNALVCGGFGAASGLVLGWVFLGLLPGLGVMLLAGVFVTVAAFYVLDWWYGH